MRALVLSFTVSLAIFLALVSLTQLIANSRYLGLAAAHMGEWAEGGAQEGDKRFPLLIRHARSRAWDYERLISRDHLDHGLLVNRSSRDGAMLNACDSLLFSCLRWVSLHKLGFDTSASAAYKALRFAQVEGEWFRHPRCRELGLSRDMLTGILIMFSQEPGEYREDLQRLVARIREGDGFFSQGPSYLSYLTPGLGKILRMLLTKDDLRVQDVPAVIRGGYSTNEFSLLWMAPGYEAHLAALSLWLEMELMERRRMLLSNTMTRFESQWGSLVQPFSGVNPFTQKHQWTAYRLVQIDPRNIFFRYLRMRSIGVLNQAVAAKLLRELLSMPQFPIDRLPQSCDRKADYLWQRASVEYDDRDSECARKFHGTDFLWMASLLVEALEAPKLVH